MAYETLIVTVEDGVALVRLNQKLLGELAQALAALDANDAARCIVLTGSDKAFAAGADIREMAGKDFVDVFAGDLFTPETEAMLRVRKPIIAAVAAAPSASPASSASRRRWTCT